MKQDATSQKFWDGSVMKGQGEMILEIMMWGFFSAWGSFGASYVKDQIWKPETVETEKKDTKKND